ncbi:MAG: MlaD family protein [Kiloniellaceae bacterium]
MYNKRINYVAVGLFVSAMLIAAAISVALLSGRTGPTDRYYVVLDNVADIKFGTQVRYEGYPIGQVQRIAPVPDGARMRFRVDLNVARGWRIPADSVARIGSSGFLAAKTIDIAGGGDEITVPIDGQIASAAPADIFAAITTTAAEISELNRTNIRPLLENLNALVRSVDRDAPRITERLATFAERLNATLVPLQEILASDNVAAIQRTIGNVEQTTQTLAATSRKLGGTLRKIDSLVANLDELVEANKAGVDQSLNDLQYTLASIARTVDTIVHNLEGTARNMNEFSRLIRNNPGLLLDGTPREAVSPANASERGLEQ